VPGLTPLIGPFNVCHNARAMSKPQNRRHVTRQAIRSSNEFVKIDDHLQNCQSQAKRNVNEIASSLVISESVEPIGKVSHAHPFQV
jgi:hypothetical protein